MEKKLYPSQRTTRPFGFGIRRQVNNSKSTKLYVISVYLQVCFDRPTFAQGCAPHRTLNLVQLLPDGFVERLDGYQVSWLPHEHRGVMAWSETSQRIALGASTGVVTIVDIAKPRSVMKVRSGFASGRHNLQPDSESTSRIAFPNFPWALSRRA